MAHKGTRVSLFAGIFVLTLLTLVEVVLGLSKTNDIDWTAKAQLGRSGYEAKWFTGDKEWITMEIKAPTTGWVAVGFSNNGAMKGADIIMGWVDDTTGQVYIKDLHGVGNEVPVEDALQNVELLHGETKDGYTTIRFRRGWKTCDEDNDYVIGTQTVKMIWSFGNTDPPSDTEFNPVAHDRHHRGIKLVNLKLPAQHTKFPEDLNPPDPNIKHFDIIMNKQYVPGNEVTEYFCQFMKYPNFEEKAQIVGWRPMIQPENAPVVHHIVIYECIVPEGNSSEIFEKHVGQVESCYAPSMPPDWLRYCWTQPLVWTIGGEGDMFPVHTGMPIGEKHGGSTYFFMEMHYDLPELKPVTDSSGLRIYYTDKPREQDLSTIFIGKRFSTFHFIAPGVKGYKAFGGCTSECTQKTIPADGITLTHALMHAHQVTTKISLRHVRNGVELPTISSDTNYDINYQQAHVLQPIKILPGDELYTYCEYDTTERDIPLWGGITTNDTEMCHTFLTYYPKIPLATCQWQTEYNDFLNAFDINGLEGDILPIVSTPYDPTADLKYDPPDEVFVLLAENRSTNLFTQLKVRNEDLSQDGKNFWDWLTSLDWKKDDAKLANNVNRKLEKSRNYAYCTEHAHIKIPLDKYIMDPPEFKEYVDPESKVCNSYVTTTTEIKKN